MNNFEHKKDRRIVPRSEYIGNKLPSFSGELFSTFPLGGPKAVIWRWGTIMLAGCLIAPFSLYVHDFMLEFLRIPYPTVADLPIWAAELNLAIKLAAVAWFCRISFVRMDSKRALVFAALTSILILMFHETGRVIIIEHSIFDSWPVSLLDGIPSALTLFVETFIIAFAASRGVPWPVVLIVDIIVTIIGTAYASPLLVNHFGYIRNTEYQNVVALYSDPYPRFLNVVIYTAFLEPTFAVFAFAIFSWDRIAKTLAKRTLAFMFIMLLIRGRLVQEFVFSFWTGQRLGMAFISTGQFLLETMVMSILVGLTWEYAGPRSFDPSSMCSVAASGGSS